MDVDRVLVQEDQQISVPTSSPSASRAPDPYDGRQAHPPLRAAVAAVAARGRRLQQVAVLHARRLGRPSWTSYRGRGAPPGWRTAKTTLAAVLAYELARRLLRGGPVPLLAPLTALLVAQITVVETVK